LIQEFTPNYGNTPQKFDFAASRADDAAMARLAGQVLRAGKRGPKLETK